MKRFLISTLLVAISVMALLSFVGCSNFMYAGTYEMVGLSGEVTVSGQTIQLNEDLFDYYRIILNEDGSAKIQSKAKSSTTSVEAEGTWEFSDGKLKIKHTNSAGITTIEEMDLENGKITYNASQTIQGMNVQMQIVLEKK